MNDDPIVEAKVLSYYNNPIELNKEINTLIEDGWELYGETVVSIAKTMTTAGYTDITLVYTQTMVKRVMRPSAIPDLEPMGEYH